MGPGRKNELPSPPTILVPDVFFYTIRENPSPIMMRRDRDDALSEVIGFVLILGVIAIAVSLYLTYSVPVHGREMEIAHMNYVKEQLMGMKGDIDSLWINDKPGFRLYRSINLGTQGSRAQGGFISIPLLTPLGSSGTLAINERKDRITITTIPAPARLESRSDTILYPGIPALLNITHIPDRSILIVDNKGTIGITIAQTTSNITISTTKMGAPVLSNLTIVNNPLSGQIYPVNLLDDSYGLNSGISYPFYLEITSGADTAGFSIPGKYALQGLPLDLPVDHEMGSVEYRSKNNYWIFQDYYYQNGGVFLTQDDGMAVKVNPEISITQKEGYTIVSVVDIRIKEPLGISQVSGTGPVQLSQSIDPVRHSVITDLQEVSITVEPSGNDAATANMWCSVFGTVPIPQSPTNEARLTVYGNQVILDYIEVPVSVTLQSNIAI